MSVIVKGMEMPDSCIACKFGREVNYTGDFEEKCLINDKCGYVSVRKPRLDTCPLVEVKTPHGRLVDADKLFEEINTADEYGADMSDILRLVIDAPTVIEAEGRET